MSTVLTHALKKCPSHLPLCLVRVRVVHLNYKNAKTPKLSKVHNRTELHKNHACISFFLPLESKITTSSISTFFYTRSCLLYIETQLFNFFIFFTRLLYNFKSLTTTSSVVSHSSVSGGAIMSAKLCSQGGLVLATAMVVSSTVILLTFSRQKTLIPSKQTLRSCLSSEGKKRYKKKKVKFAENVKETNGNGKEYRNEQRKKLIAEMEDGPRKKADSRFCRNEMPANRIALYNGILRDRVHNMMSSY